MHTDPQEQPELQCEVLVGSHQAPTATTRGIETSPGRDGEATGLVAGRVPRS